MIWLIALVVANIAIFALEYIYRTSHFSSFLTALPYILIPALIGQAGLFYGYRFAPSFLLGAVVFTAINQTLRPLNIYLAGEKLSVYGYLAIVCVLIGVLLSAMDKYSQ